MSAPRPLGPDWKPWGERLTSWLNSARNILVESLDFSQTAAPKEKNGRLWWNNDFETLNIGHNGGVVQQVGQEQFMYVENATGSTINNGEVVGFSGVSGNIRITKYVADGSMSELYFIGVATQDIPNGTTGMVTLYGRVNDIDTTGTPVSETWASGDILYASTTTAGKFTKVRPTAPNAVIVVAAVLSVSSTAGSIMVRPTIPIGLDYGSFSDTTVQTIAAINTAYPIKHNTTDISQGISVVNDGSGNPTKLTVTNAGLYKVTVSNQYTSSNSSAQNIQTWLRQNGTDISNSNSYLTIANNGATAIFSTAYVISMQAGDYLQIMWASDSTNVKINNIAATAYSPAAPSVITSITQIQL